MPCLLRGLPTALLSARASTLQAACPHSGDMSVPCPALEDISLSQMCLAVLALENTGPNQQPSPGQAEPPGAAGCGAGHGASPALITPSAFSFFFLNLLSAKSKYYNFPSTPLVTQAAPGRALSYCLQREAPAGD